MCPFCSHDKPEVAVIGNDVAQIVVVTCRECGAIGHDQLVTIGRDMRRICGINGSASTSSIKTAPSVPQLLSLRRRNPPIGTG